MVEIARNLIQKHLRPVVLVAVVVGLVMASCSNGESGSDLDPQLPATPRSTTAIGTATITSEEPAPTSFLRPTSISGPTETAIPEPITAAVAQAATDYEVSPGDIVILRFMQGTWPSTALGCPEEGRSYAQIVTSGFEVVLSVAGELAFYHVDLTGAAIVECEGDEGG